MKRYHHFFWNKTFPEGLPPEFLHPSLIPPKAYGFPVPCHGNPSTASLLPGSTTSKMGLYPAFIPTSPMENCFLLASRESALYFTDFSPIPFSGHILHRGGAISHTPGEYMFLLKEPGIYEIFYSVNVSNADGNFPKTARVGLYLSGKPIPGTFWEQTFVTAEQTLCISAVTAVSVTDAPAPLWLHNESSSVSYNQCTLLLHKICN